MANPSKISVSHSSSHCQRCGLQMYFDDCERRDVEGWEPPSSSSWSVPFSDEKQKALERHLGFNPDSASKLTRDQVEEETLLWAVDTNIVWDCEEEECDTKTIPSKYHTISDLVVATNCTTAIESLAFLWSYLMPFFEANENSVIKDDTVHMIVFPQTRALWDYDKMVTMLRSIEICKTLLPPHIAKMKLDLFHPDYKHAPRMWSPQTHSPFPTIGIQFVSSTKTKYSFQDGESQNDIDAARDKLKALFDSTDAIRSDPGRAKETTRSESQVMDQCQQWMSQHSNAISAIEKEHTEWKVEMNTEPYQLYNTLWNVIEKMSIKRDSNQVSSSLIVMPFLDAHTTHRAAVTVNAALRRFCDDIRIANVFHPDGKNSYETPHPIIHLVRR